MLAISIRYAAVLPGEWARRSKEPPSPFDAFVDEARRTIPESARVRLRAPGGKLGAWANSLSARLHPRAVVWDGAALDTATGPADPTAEGGAPQRGATPCQGPAEWEIELPPGEFDRSRAAIRRLAP